MKEEDYGKMVNEKALTTKKDSKTKKDTEL